MTTTARTQPPAISRKPPTLDWSMWIATDFQAAKATAQEWADEFGMDCVVFQIDPKSPMGQRGEKYGHLLAKEVRDMPRGLTTPVLFTAEPSAVVAARAGDECASIAHVVPLGVVESNGKRLESARGSRPLTPKSAAAHTRTAPAAALSPLSLREVTRRVMDALGEPDHTATLKRMDRRAMR